ncbi:MAG: type II toxin-antitoxin system VapC family toxin [Acidobacteriota bacterium]
MKALLDTEAFLWFLSGDPRLSASARGIIEKPENDILLSIASIWEIAIKMSIGKLNLSSPIDEFIPQQLALQHIGVLNLELPHVLRVATLPFHHRDPFDRILVAQALTENLSIVCSDAAFDAYGVGRLW